MNGTRLNVVENCRHLFAAIAICVLPMAQEAWAQASGDQYDVAVRMEMMGMAMPPISQRLCVRKGADDGDFVPRQQNCHVSDATRSGSRLTFKIACAGANPMTGAGDFTFNNGYNGQIRLKGKIDGQDVEMTQSIGARRVGAG